MRKDEFIPVNEPVMGENAKKYLVECIDSGWISSEGPFVLQFEKKMCERVGRNFGIAVTNGTAALEIAVRALGIGPGDEVIMPTLTIISCAMAVTNLGAIPVFVDSNVETWNMKVEDIEAKITDKTKAIMAVHLYGLPIEMDEILTLAEAYGLKVIEDAAQMHGQTYKGKPCGSFGDVSTFSFYPNKLVTTGEGGMIVTDDEEIAEKCRCLRNLCFQKDARYHHYELSSNYRFTNIQAALGLAQLEQLDAFVEKKRSMGHYYTELLADVAGIKLPIPKTSYAENIYWAYGIVLEEDIPVDNVDMQGLLTKEGIGTRTFFWCMHEQPVYLERGLFSDERYPDAEYLARRGLYLPSGLALSEVQMERAADVLKGVLERLKI